MSCIVIHIAARSGRPAGAVRMPSLAWGRGGWVRCLILIAALAACLRCEAASPDPVPAFVSRLMDQAAVLQPDERAELRDRLDRLQRSGRCQAAVLILTAAPSEPLAQYAVRVAEAWRLGRAGHDDGLLIVLVPSVPSARIEVGYGLEGGIPDVVAARWVDEMLPRLRQGNAADALRTLMDHVEAALAQPGDGAAKPAATNILDRDPRLKLPFLLLVFSPFAIFPLFMGPWGSLAGAPALAGFYGGAAWALWHSPALTAVVAACALPLPVLWSLNGVDDQRLRPLWRTLRTAANALGVALFFLIVTAFVGVGLSAMVTGIETWVAPMFAGLLATGLAAILFPPLQGRLMVVLRSMCHFAFALIVAWFALQPLVARPTVPALAAAATFTALVALSLYLDSREHGPGMPQGGVRWSRWSMGCALLGGLPFALLLLAQAALGDDPQTRLLDAVTGGGALATVAWWAARHGLLALLGLGLGGRFGGGGAGRD